MKTLLLLALCVCACAQTRVLLKDASPGASPPVECQIVVFVPARGYISAALGPGITCDASGAVVWIRVAAAAVPGTDGVTEVLVAAGSQVMQTKGAVAAGTERVYRNGLRMAPGIDYNVVALGIAFLPGQVLQAGDVVIVEYRTPALPTGG